MLLRTLTDLFALANGNGIDESYNNGSNGAYFYLYDPFGDPMYTNPNNQDFGSTCA